ncbi:hypothetical protein GOBAR_DD01343 [Gossypium barbadense]|nr:hypothetical protein GOBAR_DD01343 [Gossypium barbadense]
MKDPVTATTGITYDRESIEQWLLTCKNTSCPVTQQPLPPESDLTPNHTLRRLIQSWCTENASLGVDRIPTPKPSVDKSHFFKLIKQLQQPGSNIKALQELDFLAAKNERNRKFMVETGVPKALLSFIVNCFEETSAQGFAEALRVLVFIRIPLAEAKIFLQEYNDQIIKSLIWVLGCEFKPQVMGMNAALHALLIACPWGRNRLMMVESGAVSALIELELGSPEKRTTELIVGILFHLCCCADGRAEFLSHKGGLAVVAKRIMKVSPTADDRAVFILSLISKFVATNSVLEEMVEVGTVTKLCMMLQVDSTAPYLKEKAMGILRSHTDEWRKFPCIDKTFHKVY